MKTLSYLMVIFIIFGFAGVGSAQVIEVGDGHTYNTIAEGVNAAESGDTVFVHEGIYSINSAITVKSNIIVCGEGGNKSIIYTDSFSDISSADSPAMFYINGVKNVEIYNFTFIGPAKSVSEQHSNGGTTSIGGLREARNGIKLQGASNISIHDCYFTLLLSDGIRSSASSGVKVYKCKFESAGHDSISLFHCKDIAIDNCRFDLMINTCIRFDGVQGCSVTNSTFVQTRSGTGAGYLELENIADGIMISKNAFLASADPVVFTASSDSGIVSITDNVLYKCNLASSYSPYRVTLEDNVQYASEQDWGAMGYGYNAKATPTLYFTKYVDDGEDETEEEEEIEINNTAGTSIIFDNCTDGNCTAVNETASVETNMSSVVNEFFDDLCAKYFDFSSESACEASSAANDSIEDIEQAKVLMNGTSDEQILGEKYLQSGKLKLQYAQDMLNLSKEGLESAEERMNSSQSS